jgi:hypothetical protein
MRLPLKAEDMTIVAMPDTAEGGKCVRAYVKELKTTFYLNMEPGEIDYTGFAKGRCGIGYRLHLVRNANLAPRTIVLEMQNDVIEDEYKILMICQDERGLPLKSRMNETYRVPHIVFENAHDCAEYEDYLTRTYDEEGRPSYSIRSWQENTPIETLWGSESEEFALPNDGTTLEDL